MTGGLNEFFTSSMSEDTGQKNQLNAALMIYDLERRHDCLDGTY
jgi:hypothetical protein